MPASLPGQISLHGDTIPINEVVIRSKDGSGLLPGYETYSVDSSLLRQYGSKDISDVLNENSAVLIKSYGQGGIATPAFRGTAASHTRVAWDNIDINNPMTGQFDLSLVPAGFIDKVDVYFGAGSMGISTGGLGGTINMVSLPEWDNRFSLFVNPSAGSFGRFSGLVKLNAGNNKFQSATKLIHQSAENNFPYINSVSGEEPVRNFRKNNQLSQNGFLEELYFRAREGIVSAKFWYQSSSRNLPEPIISMQDKLNETQRDESFRTVVSYTRDKGSGTLNLTGAFINDYLNYQNRLAAIDSRNNAGRFVLKGDYSFMIGTRTRFRTDFNEGLNIVRTNNYSSTRSRNIVSIGGQTETQVTDRFLTTFLLKETIDGTRFLLPDFSLAAQYKIVPGEEYYLGANLSKNSRIPSLNDLFWTPGGNPDLRSETGFSSELIFKAGRDLSRSVHAGADLALYYTLINDMIQWQPGNYSYWEATNIGATRSSGLESSFRIYWTSSDMRLSADAKYILTNAHIVNSGGDAKRLAYIPLHRLNGIVRFDWNQFYVRIVSNSSSRRYITTDKGQYLPGYFINDLDIGSKLNLRKTWYEISLEIMNVFNVNYQSIAWYPMPGRAFMLSVIFQIKK
jgi:iron complex outermembrane receptor protein